MSKKAAAAAAAAAAATATAAASSSSSQSQTLAMACLECKRLKLKCSKTVPCDACKRRGCESICPNGQLRSGRGTRFILQNTEELHDEMDKLRDRIKELEKALAEVQSKVSNETHPLLKSSLAVPGNAGPVKEDVTPTCEAQHRDEEDLIDTFGSLSISADGSSEWYGRHGGSEFFVAREEQVVSQEEQDSAKNEVLPLDLVFLSRMFPFKSTSKVDDEVRRYVRSQLPPRDVAWEIVKAYHIHICWATNPEHWQEFLDTAMEPVYTLSNPRDGQVALLFIVLALGTSLDLNREPFDPEARRYVQLSKISLMLGEDILVSSSSIVVQYLHLLSLYYQISDDPSGPTKAWSLAGMAVRAAQSAGYHRDSELWDQYPQVAEGRRRLWWEIATFEFIQAFGMNRPRFVNPIHCDAKMPIDTEDSTGVASWSRSKYKWMQQCLIPVIEKAFAAKPPPYADILKFDREIRDYPLPEIPSTSDVSAPAGTRVVVMLMRSFSMTGLRELALLYMHRTYLIEALVRWPEDPLRSRYALSVLASHRSSLLIIQGLDRLQEQLSRLIPRIFFMYLHCLSAYVCLCAIVIRSPGCPLAKSSLVEIDRGKKLFLTAQMYRVSKTRNVIERLHRQAHAIYESYLAGKWKPPKTGTSASVVVPNEQTNCESSGSDSSPASSGSSGNHTDTSSENEDVDYVLRFAGYSGFFCTSSAAAPSPGNNNDTVTSATIPTPPNPPSNSQPGALKENHPLQPMSGLAAGQNSVHPTLYEYLRTYQTSTPAVSSNAQQWVQQNQHLSGIPLHELGQLSGFGSVNATLPAPGVVAGDSSLLSNLPQQQQYQLQELFQSHLSSEQGAQLPAQQQQEPSVYMPFASLNSTSLGPQIDWSILLQQQLPGQQHQSFSSDPLSSGRPLEQDSSFNLDQILSAQAPQPAGPQGDWESFFREAPH